MATPALNTYLLVGNYSYAFTSEAIVFTGSSLLPRSHEFHPIPLKNAECLSAHTNASANREHFGQPFTSGCDTDPKVTPTLIDATELRQPIGHRLPGLLCHH